MYNNDEITLTVNDIYEMDFKIDTRGYRPQEVDKCLDIVMHDYNAFNHQIKKLKEENKAISEELASYKQEVRRLKTLLETANNSTANESVNNVDLLRRLSNLEKVVFGRNE